MNISTDFGVWIAFILTMAVFSGVFKENLFFKIAESLFIGVSAGYFASVWFLSIMEPAFNDILENNQLLLIPVLSGFLLFLPSKKDKWNLSVIPAGFILLLYVAMNFVVYFEAYIYEMVFSSVIPLVVFNDNGSIVWDLTINSLVSVVGVVSVLVFLFSRQHSSSKSVRVVGNTGRFYLLVAMGTCFGYTLVSRIILLAGRVDFILRDFLGIAF